MLETRGQLQLTFLRFYPPSFVDRVSMPWDLPSSLGLMEGAPKMYLSVSLQGWDYKKMPLHPAWLLCGF